MLNIIRFQTLSKFLSIFFKILAVLVLTILVIGSFNVFIRQNFISLTFDRVGAISFLYSDVTVAQDDYDWAISIVIPIILAFLAYIFFKISYLFDYLNERHTPFTHKFARSVKVIGFLLIIADLSTSLLYIFLVNFALDEGVFFYFSLSSFFFIGLILYLTSGILNYGIDLQELAKEPFD